MGHEELPPSMNELSRRIIGAAIEVHRELGTGLLESVYESALCAELDLEGVAHTRQAGFVGAYKGTPLPPQRIDLVVEDTVIVELKAVRAVEDAHLAQLVSYLRLTRRPLGLLINFHAPTIKQGVHRRINSAALSVHTTP